MLPLSTREHRDIVDKIAARNAAGAGKALYEHAMASRARMHRSQENGATASHHLAIIAPRKTK
jgi:DNA-binding FadR family transcriptional regulator